MDGACFTPRASRARACYPGLDASRGPGRPLFPGFTRKPPAGGRALLCIPPAGSRTTVHEPLDGLLRL